MDSMRKFSGSTTASGTVTLKQDAVGFFTDSGSSDVWVGQFPYKTADVSVGGAATVAIQGCVGDPSVSGNWYDISSVSASGFLRWVGVDEFVRANVTSYTSGTVSVRLSATGS